MTMTPALKIGIAVIGVIVLIGAWSGMSEYLARRQADELTQNLARVTEQNALEAKAKAQQYHDQVEANLARRREDLYNTYQQVNDEARQYKAEQAIRLEKQRQDALRLQASYILGANQQCVGGVVITRNGTSFTQNLGKDGQAIACKGQLAQQPLH